MKPTEAYILNQPEPFRSILLHVQLLIAHQYPEAEVKLKWKIPVYYIEGKPLCYLNAAIKNGYVDVGFWASDILKKYDNYLVSEGRKVVKSLRYFCLEDVKGEVFIEILNTLYEAKGTKFYKKHN